MGTAHARLRDFLPNARELALLFAARGLACMGAWHAGFRALSDDDYARIAIAQRFAQAPRFDPTGTSWLPAPFWIYGAMFRCFGTGLGVARAAAIAAALAATVLVYVAARLLGAAPFSALVGAAFSALLVPYSVVLGLAAVPEVPCAALIVFAAASLSQPALAVRGLGGASLFVACLSRYEAWPVALIFSLYCVWDALRERRPAVLGCAVSALAAPTLWMILGHVRHGDALFFVARVTAYRRALGGAEASLLQRVSEYPRLLIWDGLTLLPLLLSSWLVSRNQRTSDPLSYRRMLVALSALLSFLMLGSVRDGVPTHHAARVLLPIWFFAALVVGHWLGRRAITPALRARIGLVVALIAGCVLFRANLALPDAGFAERAAELEAGAYARQYAPQTLAIDTPDYGYFAVQAGFGSPGHTVVLQDHDPRHPGTNPFRDATSVERALREHGAALALVSNAHASLLKPRCAELWQNTAFVLLRCPL